MKKWYLWLLLSLIFAVGGVLNYLEERSIIGSAIQVGLTVLLAIAQLICDRHGEQGKKVFRTIAAVLTVLLVAFAIVMIVKTFR